MLGLPTFETVLSEFASDLASSDVHARALAFMTMRALLQASNGGQRVKIATTILENLPVSCLEDLDVALRNAKSLGEARSFFSFESCYSTAKLTVRRSKILYWSCDFKTFQSFNVPSPHGRYFGITSRYPQAGRHPNRMAATQ